MTSLKPYLIRAVYEWIVANDLTPYLLVDATNPYARVPKDYIENGKIILNIKPAAVLGLKIGDEDIEFNARFSGRPMHIIAPVEAVLAIYANENGQGMVFDSEENDEEPPPPPPPVDDSPKRSHLRVVK